MTCREKLRQEKPHCIRSESIGGCIGCPSHYDYLPDPEDCERTECRDCWDREIPDTEKILNPDEKDAIFKAVEDSQEKKEEPADKIDIHKIIDEAMEKKDRTVSIYIGNSCVTINVTPYEPEEPAHWIYAPNNDGYPYECSACGVRVKYHSLYCSYCGEQMKMPKEDETDE